jgi:hypothetical protein
LIGILIYNDNPCVSMLPKSFDWIFSYIIALLNRPIPFPPSLSERRRLRHLLTFQSSFLSPYPPISGSPHLHF